MLRPGGMLLYSTCTFDGLENEGTIGYLLEQYPEFTIEEIRPYEGFCAGMPGLWKKDIPDLKKTVRIFPHKMKGEGHYIALLRKNGEHEMMSDGSKKRPKKLAEELEAFLAQVDWEKAGIDFKREQLEFHGERVYYMPENLPDMAGIRFLRTGLLMGELKKNRFEPSQALAMCLNPDAYGDCISLSVDDDRVVRYLKGETLDVEDVTGMKKKGWHLFCVDGYPLGWGKLASGTLKNKYLPGWRWQS